MKRYTQECRGKHSYPTQRDAANARQSLIHRKGRAPGENGKVNIYGCGECGGFHIGHARRHLISRPKRGGDRVLTRLKRYRALAQEGV